MDADGGFLVAAGAVAACLAWEATAARIAWLSAAGLGLGAALPCLDAFITEGIEKAERGTISSLYSSMRFVGVAAGPPAASLLLRQSVPLLLWVMAACAAAACLLALAAIRPKSDERARSRLASRPHSDETAKAKTSRCHSWRNEAGRLLLYCNSSVSF